MTVDGQIQWTFGPVGSIGFLTDFEFYMTVLGVGRGPIGFVPPLRLKTLDSQPDSSNTGPVPTDFHDLCDFRKSCHGFLTWYLPCFGPGASRFAFSQFSVGTKKMRDEQLCRFVVVSPREVLSLPVSCPFKILNFLSFLKVRSPFRPQKFHQSLH